MRISRKTIASHKYYSKGRITYTVNNRKAVNPKYNRLIEFLLHDKTHTRRYVKHKFTCNHFAMLMHDRAESAGIKCGVVTVWFKGTKSGHKLNVFNVIGRGIVYIDICGDNEGGGYTKIVNVKCDEEYKPNALFYRELEFYSAGIVEGYSIFW